MHLPDREHAIGYIFRLITSMKILFLTNFFPPYHIGGYELGCKDVVLGLERFGHDVKVITSTYGLGRIESGGRILRWLCSSFGWDKQKLTSPVRWLIKEIINKRAFSRVIKGFAPDVVYIWNLAHISVSTVFQAQVANIPTCYFISDNWLARLERDYWYHLWKERKGAVLTRFDGIILRPILRRLGLVYDRESLDLRYVHFVSQYLKQFALDHHQPVEKGCVIHWSVDSEHYAFRDPTGDMPSRLLYVGQIIEHKGVTTAVEAFDILHNKFGRKKATLTFAGKGIYPEYETQIRANVVSKGLNKFVKFLGQVPRDELISVYHDHDILILPSIWDEPFSITMLEAMSSGLAVIGTPTGGTSELLDDSRNALIFPKGDALACALQIERLLNDNELYKALVKNARQDIERDFQFDGMIGRIEMELQNSVGSVGITVSDIERISGSRDTR